VVAPFELFCKQVLFYELLFGYNSTMMTGTSSMPGLKQYPRMTLRCKCENEFNINVIRLKNGEVVVCQICGATFPPDLGEKFASALQEMFTIKHELDKRDCGFDLSFLYKSTFRQPPAPYPFDPEDFETAP
jgi:ribosomal protein S27E